MCYLAESHAFPHEVSTFIYIYIYILISLENNLGYYSHKNYSKRGYKFVATFNVHFVIKKS